MLITMHLKAGRSKDAQALLPFAAKSLCGTGNLWAKSVAENFYRGSLGIFNLMLLQTVLGRRFALPLFFDGWPFTRAAFVEPVFKYLTEILQFIRIFLAQSAIFFPKTIFVKLLKVSGRKMCCIVQPLCYCAG